MTDDPHIPCEIPGIGEQEMPEGVFNSASRKSVRNRETEQKLRLLGKDEELKQFMSKKYGRAFVFDMLAMGGMWGSPADPARDRNEHLWYREGARQMAIELNTAAWRAAPQFYKLMMDENTNLQ